MKSCLSSLGVVFLVLVIVGGALFGYVAYNGSKLDASSKKYVDDNIPVIVGAWNKDELLKRASPELMKAAPEGDIASLFSQLNTKLGSLVEYKGAKGEAICHTSLNPESSLRQSIL